MKKINLSENEIFEIINVLELYENYAYEMAQISCDEDIDNHGFSSRDYRNDEYQRLRNVIGFLKFKIKVES